MKFGPALRLRLHLAARLRAWLRPALLALIASVCVTPAWADMWSYVDAQGVAHFSASRLDERYELFFRGDKNFNVGKTDETYPTATAAHPTTDKPTRSTLSIVNTVETKPKLLTYFDVSPHYKAVKHLLREASLMHGIDYELLQALIATESGFNASAVSPKGAIGLMQLIPPTAARYGVKADKDSPVEKKLTDPKINIGAGSTYLRYLINLFPGQLELALAAYNAGEGAVQRAGNKIPNYPETKNYVKTVMQRYTQLKPPSLPSVPVFSTPGGRVRMEMMGGVVVP